MVRCAIERAPAGESFKHALRQLEGQKKALDSFAIVAETDAQGRIIYVNDQFCTVSKYLREELIGKDHRDVVNSGYHPKEFWTQLWETISQGRVWRGDIRNRAKDGSIYWVDATIVPLLGSAGKPEKYLSIRAVITERKQAEAALAVAVSQLQGLARLKDEWISTVSHELKTPLAITREGISLMLDEVVGPTTTKQKKVLITAQSNIDRLARMINDLLDMSKLEAGKIALKRDRVDLAARVKEVLETFESRANAKGIALVADVPAQGASVYADADKLTQVLTNLVSNALKFTEQGQITLSIREYPDDVICTVEDSGKGIAKEDLPKVFSKFQQFDRVVGAGEQGTGLGLSIAKGLIELHGGVIQVESEVNKGATFTFTLPKYSMETLLEEDVTDGIQEAVENSARMSVLVVNCSPEPRERVMERMHALIKSGLRRKGDMAIRTPEGVVVLLPDCDRTGALSVKARLVQAIQDWIVHEPLAERVTLHIGCATYPDDAREARGLIAWATQAASQMSGAAL